MCGRTSIWAGTACRPARRVVDRRPAVSGACAQGVVRDGRSTQPHRSGRLAHHTARRRHARTAAGGRHRLAAIQRPALDWRRRHSGPQAAWQGQALRRRHNVAIQSDAALAGGPAQAAGAPCAGGCSRQPGLRSLRAMAASRRALQRWLSPLVRCSPWVVKVSGLLSLQADATCRNDGCAADELRRTRRSTAGAAQRLLPEDSTSISCAYFGSGSLARPPSSTSSQAISLAGLVALAFFETRCGTRGASYQDCPTE